MPIYKLTYDLLLRLMVATKDFPREYKYTLGEKLKNEVMDLVVLIYRANSTLDRVAQVTAIVERVQLVQAMIRLAHDLRILPLGP